MKRLLLVSLLSLCATLAAYSQPDQGPPSKVQTIEIKSPVAEAEVGKPIKFSATVKDATGKILDEKPSAWFAAPFDLAHAAEDGTVSFFQPGEVMVGAIVGGKPGFTTMPDATRSCVAARYRVTTRMGTNTVPEGTYRTFE